MCLFVSHVAYQNSNISPPKGGLFMSAFFDEKRGDIEENPINIGFSSI
jgi:hypothetical protein